MQPAPIHWFILLQKKQRTAYTIALVLGKETGVVALGHHDHRQLWRRLVWIQLGERLANALRVIIPDLQLVHLRT